MPEHPDHPAGDRGFDPTARDRGAFGAGAPDHDRVNVDAAGVDRGDEREVFARGDERDGDERDDRADLAPDSSEMEDRVRAQVWRRPDGSRYIIEANFDRDGNYTGHPETEGRDDVNITPRPELAELGIVPRGL